MKMKWNSRSTCWQRYQRSVLISQVRMRNMQIMNNFLFTCAFLACAHSNELKKSSRDVMITLSKRHPCNLIKFTCISVEEWWKLFFSRSQFIFGSMAPHDKKRNWRVFLCEMKIIRMETTRMIVNWWRKKWQIQSDLLCDVQ